jgi:patatin-related protein
MAEAREELRLALVMNGGVSLAVWMGGVSNEIFRLVTQKHPVYAALLDLTHTTARVDVISGTSAGGVNGTALSLALLYGGDFSQLRGVWLKTGALSSLLRAPLGENPGSLLRGDDFFLPEIRAAFEQLASDTKPFFTPAEMPIDLRMTTTLLRGVQGNTVDDLGTAIHDVDYRAQFRFRYVANKDDFSVRNQAIADLSLAARSTASFPFAFEPSAIQGMGDRFVDSQDREILDEQVDGSSTIASRYVVDGGVLNNKPFRGALRSIFLMPAGRGVRRVLAYINPDPGDGPPGKPRAEPPPLSKVLGASVFGIPQSQAIADQLAEVQSHNDHVRARRESVFSTVVTLDDRVLDQLPADLFNLYRQHRLISTFDSFVYEELPAAARRRKLPPASAVVGRHGYTQMRDTFTSVPWNGWIPVQWPAKWAPLQPTPPGCDPNAWEWGMFPVEFTIKVLLDLLRRTQRIYELDRSGAAGDEREAKDAGTTTSMGQPPDWNDPSHAMPQSPTSSMVSRIASAIRNMTLSGNEVPQIATWDREAVRRKAAPSDEDTPDWLAQAWQHAYECVASAEAQRVTEDAEWHRIAEAVVDLLNGGEIGRQADAGVGQGGPSNAARKPERQPDVRAVTGEVFTRLFSFLTTPERIRACGELMHRVADVALAIAKAAETIADRVAARADLREHERELGLHLARFLRWLAQEPTECAVIRRLMQLEVIEHARISHDALEDDTLIELAQISGNSASPLGGPWQAKDKLLGLQLAHFGAFYKESWRANDWTYGRLDGSERLVKILLNPDRLQRCHRNSAEAVRIIKAIALDDIVSPVLRAEVARIWQDMGYLPKLQAELAFLGDPSAAVPDALPVATSVITLRLHFGILREEIEPMRMAIVADRAQGADALGPSEVFLQRFANSTDGQGTQTFPFSPEQAQAALKAGLIAGETLMDEAGSDLFTRTLAHTVATLQGVLSSKSAKLGPVSVFFAGLKLPVLGFYFVARGLTRQSRTSAALHGGTLAVGMSLVVAQLMLHSVKDAKPLPAPVMTFGWALLAYGLLFSVVSSPRLVGTVVTLALLAITVFMKLDVLPLLGMVGFTVLLWLSIRFRFLAFVQWVIGITAILVIAWLAKEPSFSSPLSAYRFCPTNPIDQMAALVCAVLTLAGWSASPWAKDGESLMRRWWRKLCR